MNEAVAFVSLVTVLVVGCKLLSTQSKLRKKISQFKVQRLAERLAREAIPLMGLPWKHVRGPLWIAVSEPKNGFRVQLKLVPQEDFLRIQADANFNLEPEFVSRQLLFSLLLMNGKFRMGSFGMSPTKDGYEIVHSHHCCVIGTPPQVVAAIGRNLVGQMEDTIDWLNTNDMT